MIRLVVIAIALSCGLMAACGPKPQPPVPAPYDDMGDHSCACPPED